MYQLTTYILNVMHQMVSGNYYKKSTIFTWKKIPSPDFILRLAPNRNGFSPLNIIRKFLITRVLYHIWLERNWRLLTGVWKEMKQIMNVDFSDVWRNVKNMKLISKDGPSCFNFVKFGINISSIWGVFYPHRLLNI